MKRLFVFAIGGTGARVLKSLVMLLAAGVKPDRNGPYEVVPIIIDPHKSNEDLKRTLSLLETYGAISQHRSGDGVGMFGTRLRTLEQLGTSTSKDSSTFTFQLNQVANTKFSEYIEYSTMSDQNKALASLLFSGASINTRGQQVPLLDVEMDIGFVGNPNVGSVVLNQFAESQEFRDFAANFNEGDRVFIISSIFGGTGAAGFPVILKNLRDALRKSVEGRGFVRNARIGALTIMPYFNIESDDGSPIRRSDFIAKTKAALHYYRSNVTGNKSVNMLYYLADHYHGKAYANDPGSGGQKNDAHFVELAGALAVIDFMGVPDDQLQTHDGVAVNPVYKEFAIRTSEETLSFSNLSDETQRKLMGPLAKLFLFMEYWGDQRTRKIVESEEPWAHDAPQIDTQFLSGTFAQSHLASFRNQFITWLDELRRNRRGFAPFTLGNLSNPVVGRPPKKHILSYRRFGYDSITGELNKASKTQSYSSSEAKVLQLFDVALSEALASHFDIKES